MKNHDAIDDYTDRFMTGGGKLRYVSHYRKIVTTTGKVFELGVQPDGHGSKVDMIQRLRDTDVRGKGGEAVYMIGFEGEDTPIEVSETGYAYGQLKKSPVQQGKDGEQVEE